MENGRPDGWKCQYLGKKANRYFELGADAMLIGLYEECEKYGGMWIKLDKVDDMIMLHIGKEKE